jgi:DNA-binding transcriptional LysR family regulator
MNWEKLKLFYLVARERNITQAAKILNITHSALSKQITNLEKELGVKLFRRHLRGVELTHHGRSLFPELEKMNSKIKFLCSSISSDEFNYSGTLNIASDFGFIDTWLGDRIPKFLKDYPLISLIIKAKNTALDLTKDNYDIGITTQVVDSPLVFKKVLMSWQRKLYASPEYIQEFGKLNNIHDLDNHRLISFGEDSTFPDENMDWHLKIGRKGEMRKAFLTINTMRSLVTAAKEGVGIISFSEESSLLKGSGLINVLPEIYGPRIDLYVVCLKDLYDLPAVKVFINFLFTEVSKRNE